LQLQGGTNFDIWDLQANGSVKHLVEDTSRTTNANIHQFLYRINLVGCQIHGALS
jgi:hypothetical protein